MEMYLRVYSQRVKSILLALAFLIGSLLICNILFYGKVSKVSSQLRAYEDADYSYIYVLNYGTGLNNECIFSDSDLQFYLDENGSQRLSVSSLMREDNVLYDLDYLTFLNDLSTSEVCLSKNVANKYNLLDGDTLFVEVMYSSTLVPMSVARVIDTEYDFRNPLIDNDIGVVFVGTDVTYKENTRTKYALFANDKMGNVLSDYPQVLSDEIINKTANEEFVSKQGLPAIIISVLLTIIAVYLSNYFFFSRSHKILFRLFLKGMNSTQQVLIPFLEKIVFAFLPAILIQSVIYRSLDTSAISNVYCVCPLVIYAIYILLASLLDVNRIRRK